MSGCLSSATNLFILCFFSRSIWRLTAEVRAEWNTWVTVMTQSGWQTNITFITFLQPKDTFCYDHPRDSRLPLFLVNCSLSDLEDRHPPARKWLCFLFVADSVPACSNERPWSQWAVLRWGFCTVVIVTPYLPCAERGLQSQVSDRLSNSD